MNITTMPSNPEAEAAVLGSVMCDSDVLADIDLSGDDFYSQANRSIWETMRAMAAERAPIDMVTLSSRLKKEDLLDKVGGIAYVTMLAGNVPSSSRAGYYAGLVVECSKRRRVMQIASESANRASAGEDDPDVILDSMQNDVTAAMLRGKAGDIQSTQESVMAYSDWFEKRIAAGDDTGVKAGFVDLDRLTHGWQPGDFDLIAARPSMGKTAFALNIAANACKAGKAVAVFSLEMPKEQLYTRIVSSEAAINLSRLFTPAVLNSDEHSLVMTTLEKIYDDWRLYIDDRSGITPVELAAKARRIKAKYGLDLIVIDYLQLMSGGSGHTENRTQEVAYITRSLKNIAKDLQVPVIALSQLSRGVESRQDKRPMLSDLRDSGSIEQDADVVMFLYRDDYYNPNTDKRFSELIISKQRNGPLGTVNLFFAKQFTRFASLAKYEEASTCTRNGAGTFGKDVAPEQIAR